MPVYVLADIEVLDAALFEQYRQQVPATIAAHGGTWRGVARRRCWRVTGRPGAA